jgi:hypothetical protein
VAELALSVLLLIVVFVVLGGWSVREDQRRRQAGDH